MDGKSLISTSGTELEKAGLATTAAPAPAHRSPHVARVRAPRVATPGHGVTTAVTAAARAGARVLCCERGEARGTTEQCRAPAAAHRHRHRRGQRRQFTRAFVNTSSCGPVAVWAHCSID